MKKDRYSVGELSIDQVNAIEEALRIGALDPITALFYPAHNPTASYSTPQASRWDYFEQAASITFFQAVTPQAGKYIRIYSQDGVKRYEDLVTNLVTGDNKSFALGAGIDLNLIPGEIYKVETDSNAFRGALGQLYTLKYGQWSFVTFGTKFQYSLSPVGGSTGLQLQDLVLTGNQNFSEGIGNVTIQDSNPVDVQIGDAALTFTANTLTLNSSLFESGEETDIIIPGTALVDGNGVPIWYGLQAGDWRVTFEEINIQAAMLMGSETGRRLADLRNQSTGENLTYLWTFGDGNTSTEKDPCHIYPDNQTDVDVVYNGSLQVTDGIGNSDTTNFTFTVPAAQVDPGDFEASLFVAYRILENGTKRVYFDTSHISWQASRSVYSGFWQGSITDDSAGFVDLDSNYKADINQGGTFDIGAAVSAPNQKRVNMTFVCKNSQPWERAVVKSPTISINDLTVNVQSNVVEGKLGIASHKFELIDQTNVAVVTLNASSGSLIAPSPGYYRLVYTLTTNANPSTGHSDVEEFTVPVSVGTIVESVSTIYQPDSDYDFGKIGAFSINIVGNNFGGNSYTQFFAPSGTTPQSVAIETRNAGNYLLETPQVAGGVFLNNRAGLGESGTEAALAASLLGGNYCLQISGYIGNPFLSQLVKGGVLNPDFSGGAGRAQMSMNNRGKNVLEGPVTNDAFTISAFWFGIGDAWDKTNSGDRRVIVEGNDDTLEGYNEDLFFRHKPVVQIQQGEQPKRTISGNENGPTHELLISAGGFAISNNNMGEDPETQIKKDYISTNTNGLRHFLGNWGSVEDGDTYLLIRYQRYAQGDFSGEDKLWLIPVNRLLNLDNQLKPIYEFSNVDHGEVNQNEVYLKVATFGWYNTRLENADSAVQAHIMGLNEHTIYLNKFPFYHAQNNAQVFPNNAEIVESVLTHYGLL